MSDAHFLAGGQDRPHRRAGRVQFVVIHVDARPVEFGELVLGETVLLRHGLRRIKPVAEINAANSPFAPGRLHVRVALLVGREPLRGDIAEERRELLPADINEDRLRFDQFEREGERHRVVFLRNFVEVTANGLFPTDNLDRLGTTLPDGQRHFFDQFDVTNIALHNDTIAFLHIRALTDNPLRDGLVIGLICGVEADGDGAQCSCGEE